MLKAMGKGTNLAKKNVLAITDERRSPTLSMMEQVKDLPQLNLKEKQINEERFTRQF